jgi:hypothetical protein
MGTNWYEGMFDPDWDGFLRLSGSIAGGHAYLVYGTEAEWYWMQNSWGIWGVGGQGIAKVHRADMERLLREDGEAGAGLEVELEETGVPRPDTGSMTLPNGLSGIWRWIVGISIPALIGLVIYLWNINDGRLRAQEDFTRVTATVDASQEARVQALERRLDRFEEKLDRLLERVR